MMVGRLYDVTECGGIILMPEGILSDCTYLTIKNARHRVITLVHVICPNDM